MKKDISEMLHSKAKLLFLIIVPTIILLGIYWIIPSLRTSYELSIKDLPGSFSLNIQVMIISSIIIYPFWVLLLGITISLFRKLKPQTEGGLISDTSEALKVGVVWFIVAIIISTTFYVASLISNGEGSILNSMHVANLVALFGTAVGVIMSIVDSLFREFNPKKLPVERFQVHPA